MILGTRWDIMVLKPPLGTRWGHVFGITFAYFCLLCLIMKIAENPVLSRLSAIFLETCVRGFEPPAFWSVAKRSIQLSYTHTLATVDILSDSLGMSIPFSKINKLINASTICTLICTIYEMSWSTPRSSPEYFA